MLSAENLSHTYPSGVEALRDLTLDVARGEVVAIVGPSGCGKSTLLRLLAGLLTPTEGDVRLDGALIDGPSARVGIMFQDAALLPWRTVAQNVKLPVEIGGMETSDSRSGNNLHSPISDLLRLVGLTGFSHAYPRELSGGMAQRVALARALVTQPPVLLLDEPFGALDAMTREALTSALESIVRETETTTILVTHNIAEAVFLADRVLVMTPRPGQIAGEVRITLPRPRSWHMESMVEFGRYVGQVREFLGAAGR